MAAAGRRRSRRSNLRITRPIKPSNADGNRASITRNIGQLDVGTRQAQVASASFQSRTNVRRAEVHASQLSLTRGDGEFDLDILVGGRVAHIRHLNHKRLDQKRVDGAFLPAAALHRKLRGGSIKGIVGIGSLQIFLPVTDKIRIIIRKRIDLQIPKIRGFPRIRQSVSISVGKCRRP
ncbi:MAG: hypothetical protein AAGA62_14170, partial [Bacteroidota bacterium]